MGRILFDKQCSKNVHKTPKHMKRPDGKCYNFEFLDKTQDLIFDGLIVNDDNVDPNSLNCESNNSINDGNINTTEHIHTNGPIVRNSVVYL